MDLNIKFEAKKRELEQVERREAFLRAQLDEAVATRQRLIGQLTLIEELACEITAEDDAKRHEEDVLLQAAKEAEAEAGKA